MFQMPPVHGKKGGSAVVVGPIDAPVTLTQVNEVVVECRKRKVSKVDVLGFEFEMGLVPLVQDESKAKRVSLNLKYISEDVFDKRAVEQRQVQIYDVAYVEVLPKVDGKIVTVTLKDFGVFYCQGDLDALGEKLKPGGSKVMVESGQVVKVVKDKKGESRARSPDEGVDRSEVVGSGIFVAPGDRERMSQAIVAAISQGQKLRFSFKGCEVLTAAFLSAAVGQLYGRFPEKYFDKLLLPP